MKTLILLVIVLIGFVGCGKQGADEYHTRLDEKLELVRACYLQEAERQSPHNIPTYGGTFCNCVVFDGESVQDCTIHAKRSIGIK